MWLKTDGSSESKSTDNTAGFIVEQRPKLKGRKCVEPISYARFPEGWRGVRASSLVALRLRVMMVIHKVARRPKLKDWRFCPVTGFFHAC